MADGGSMSVSDRSNVCHLRWLLSTHVCAVTAVQAGEAARSRRSRQTGDAVYTREARHAHFTLPQDKLMYT